MTRIFAIVTIFIGFSSVAKAEFIRCTPIQQASIERAVSGAFDALSAATVAINSSNGA